jgi:hypothetical protein
MYWYAGLHVGYRNKLLHECCYTGPFKFVMKPFVTESLSLLGLRSSLLYVLCTKSVSEGQ